MEAEAGGNIKGTISLKFEYSNPLYAIKATGYINPLAAKFMYLAPSAECAGPINEPSAVKGL